MKFVYFIINFIRLLPSRPNGNPPLLRLQNSKSKARSMCFDIWNGKCVAAVVENEFLWSLSLLT